MYNHQRPDWPRFTWSGDALTDRLAAVRHRQGLLLGRMRSMGFDLRSEASLEVLISDVVKSSAIEGERLNPEEVRSSIARRLGLETAGLAVPGRDVEGVVEMMLDATQKFDEPLTAERLFGWHASLFPTGRSGMGRITVGAWRTDASGPMQVVSGPIGKERVHFEAPAAERLDADMTMFLEWFNAARLPPMVSTGRPVDPVIVAGIAHLWFVTIHPFDDGNGRIGRAIADMALARADGTKERFYSMSSQIEAERRDYYAILESTQRSGLDITRWLEWFLGCLGRSIDSAESILERVIRKAEIWQRLAGHTVNDRQRLILNRMLDDFKGFMTTSKYAKMAKCSSDTALRDIRELVAWGALVQNPGSGRSTSYRIADEA